MIIQIGTNDAAGKESTVDISLNGFLDLKKHIEMLSKFRGGARGGLGGYGEISAIHCALLREF